MNERDGVPPSPESGCRPAKILLQDLWVDGRLGVIRPPPDPQEPGRREPEALDSRWSDAPRSGEPPQPSRLKQDARLRSGLRSGSNMDSAILRHIEDCPSCQQEADELDQIGQSLQLGLDSLCGAISETMTQDIEGTLARIRELSGKARILRRIRRPLRFVLWISLLAFSLLLSVILAVTVFRALKGL